MTNEVPFSDEQINCFVDLLNNDLPDPRDKRGKLHSLALVIVGFVLATLLGRQKLSSIHRFIVNRAGWLAGLTKTKTAKPISRAHLPRLLDRLDWLALNGLIERCFGMQILCSRPKQWTAIDGKALLRLSILFDGQFSS